MRPFVNTVWDEERERIIIEGHENLETIETILKKLGWKINDYNCKRVRNKIQKLISDNKIRPRYDIILDSTEMDLDKMNFENCVLSHIKELEAIKNGDGVSNYFTKSKALRLKKKGIFDVFDSVGDSGFKREYILSDETLLLLSKFSKEIN